jgi:hypothetical protein
MTFAPALGTIPWLMEMVDQDFEWYGRLAVAEPRRNEDFYEPDELRRLVAEGNVRAWVARAGGKRVGWCAVLSPSPHHPDPDSIHLLGSIVPTDLRRRGYGTTMVASRMALLGERPYTASIAPDNVASERMMIRNGFRCGLPQPPWRTWHRPSDAMPMALVVDGDGERRYIAAGFHVERHRTPVEGGGGVVLRGLWPDPAAFHIVEAHHSCVA